MTEIEFATGEFGENYDFPFTDDLSGYTAGTLTFTTTDRLTVVKTIAITVPSSSIARWAMAATDTNIAPGYYIAQVELTGAGLKKKNKIWLVEVGISLTP